MEETIGYQALIPSDEYDSLAEWNEHAVTIDHDATKTKAAYTLSCATCGPVGSADEEGLASILAPFHEALETAIVEGAR